MATMFRDHKIARIAVAALLLSAVSASPSFASASKNQGLADAGKIVAIALPAVAGSISLYKDDWVGVVQLIAVTGLTGATAFGLKQVVRERRPDRSDWKSFPSDQSALAFAPAAYLWDRYGWEYGLPAYAAASFVGYARVGSDRHHWWDVAASAGIAWLYSRLLTSEYHPPQNFYTGAYVTPHSAFVTVNYRF